ncbi:MAG: cob(I)yrinic acid a,c-diamide adenosyltransferase [Candidatus Magasanikbacteria bacterium]|nr:cob(I)yrinic acid a,c-diamide adenosyltransferase [Candidatus Magasanikbacteria bacterium]MBT4315200.1 cob(I)yrinic acid a,c-diamide adenosyltransferase [Candidatus Magasanikbacteria bacterium]MBT4547343.1 cob(I)yrinic acid a,c-diamide adenosyltransferase [Candidatus Magasanikbacteria bacterium]MBT6819055.1 cob(I)yrinic acid a,c-diamide adenosyltransferase [Candidatus Magasanikbacteria bacterium]
MKIYTKTGDKGETSMLGGKRISKSCLEMEAIGEVDELNAGLGVLIAELDSEVGEKLVQVQHKLFVIGSNLAGLQTDLDSLPKLKKEDVEYLENWIDEMNKDLPELNNFILPGGCEGAALSYQSRTVCRRAERVMIGLSEKYEVDDLIKQYLNRLSDLLFVLGRWLNKQEGVKEESWVKG